MAKIPAPSPCTVTTFSSGNVADVTTIDNPQYIKRSYGFEHEVVKQTLRVMCIQETGEEGFVCYANKTTVDEIITKYHHDHPEIRSIWFENI